MSYYYRKGTAPEDVVKDSSKAKYHAELDNKKHKIYNLGKDKHKLRDSVRKENHGALDMDNVHKKIKEKGYHGFHNPNSGVPNAVVLYHKHPVTKDDMDKSEVLMKGFIKNAMFAGILGSSSAMAPSFEKFKQPEQTKAVETAKKVSIPKDFKNRFLDAVADVETSGGKNMNHATITNPKNMNYGTHSRSKFGIMPLTAKNIIKKDKNLRQTHSHLLALNGDKFHEAYHKDPNLDRELADKYYDKAHKIFGSDPAKLGFAWLNGRQGTKDAINAGKDIENHWHVLRILRALKKQK